MAYTKTTWVDRVVQYPTKYTASGTVPGDITLTANPGTVTQAGTPVNATNLNKIEDKLFDLDSKVYHTDTWHDLTLGNSWVNVGGNFANASYTITPDGKYALLRGSIKSGTTGSIGFTLPVGARPPIENVIPIVSLGSTTPANIDITNSGSAYINNGSANTHVSLSGIRIPLF